MNTCGLGVNEIQVREHNIEKFENQVNKNKNNKFLAYLTAVKDGNSLLRFENPSLFPRLLRLLSKTDVTNAQKTSILNFFREKNGLPGELFENEISLKGTDGSCILFPRELLGMFFTNFSEDFFPGLNDTKEMELPLGEEALSCFKEYVLTKKIEAANATALFELLQFADKICDEPFLKHCKDCISKKELISKDFDILKKTLDYVRELGDRDFLRLMKDKIYKHLLEDENKSDFNEELVKSIEDFPHEFSQCYIETKAIRIKNITGQTNGMDHYSFLDMFNYGGNVEILKYISESGPVVYLSDNNIGFLHAVPKQYRMAVALVDVSGDVVTVENVEKLHQLFPNSSFLGLDQAAVEKEIEVHPENAFAHALLGKMFLGSREFVKAEVACRRALAIDPKSTFACKILEAVSHARDFF